MGFNSAFKGLSNWICFHDDGKGGTALWEYNVMFYDARRDHSVCRL